MQKLINNRLLISFQEKLPQIRSKELTCVLLFYNMYGMEKRLFEITRNSPVALKTYVLELKALEPGYEFSGEFVDISLDGFYLRRPLSVCGYAPGSLTILYKRVGEGTKALSAMVPGQRLELLTGLGRGFDASATRSAALLAGGGLGAAPLLPLCRSLKAAGKRVSVALGFNTAGEVVLEREFAEVCDALAIATVDGSKGVRGFVTDAIEALKPEFDFYYTCGPLVMMKAVCAALDGPAEVSLEERMGCGAGLCYGCSCHTLTGPRRICKDGPVFRKEEVIWQ